MTTPHHSNGSLASWQPDPTPALAPHAGWDEGYEPHGPAEPARKFSPRVVLRAVRRNWWQILLIWSVTSAALVALIQMKVKPIFDSIAYVRIEPPTSHNPILTLNNSGATVESQLETQVQRMMTPDILGEALKDPKVAALPLVVTALDAEDAIRKELNIAPVRGTRYIKVVVSSTSSAEGVAIVNAVARAYKESVDKLADKEVTDQTRRLEVTLAALKATVDEKRAYLSGLVANLDKSNGLADGLGGADAKADANANALDKFRERENITVEEFKAKASELSQVALSVMEAEGRLERLKAEQRRSMAALKLDRVVDREIQSRPEIVRLAEEFERAQARFEKAQLLVPRKDITYRNARDQVARVRARYESTVARLRPLVRQKLEQETAGRDNFEIRTAEERLDVLQRHREGLEKQLQKMKVDVRQMQRNGQKDGLDIRLAESDLQYVRGLHDSVDKQLQAMRMDLEGMNNRVYPTFAQKTAAPTRNHRMKFMALAPAATLLLVVGLFVMLEMGAARVADPDDLQGRLQLGVLGVVPPLPSAEPSRGALPWGDGKERARRRVEEFVQSLDHLRVQLWAGRRPGAGHRCVLITSACVSEGKTTLAALLAGRCANAGLTTLLVDADLRRPALARLLEVPGEPGLADVLAGEVEPEGAMTVIGNAGGFHLMPAGRRGGDPSRLLEGPRVGELLARLRETFDIVIVDAPPVLPVPDALIVGRHTDGAVLAVRHDSSRYPLVERARQKLASVGVPILGAVVNGVRGGGANYGNYAYTTAQEERDGHA